MADTKKSTSTKTETPGPTLALGHRGGKFHYTFQLRDLDSVNDAGQHESNQAEVARQALNLGWLTTGPAEIVDTIKADAPDTRGGGSVTYAAPVVQNTYENSLKLVQG